MILDANIITGTQAKKVIIMWIQLNNYTESLEF